LQARDDLYTSDDSGAEISYPPFLWISMCMNSLKLSENESGRGLSASWRETHLAKQVI